MLEGITFDDVLLVPSYNHHESRRLVNIASTDKTGKLTLELPVMTSNMDTITESAMANFIGNKGGIGVLHRFMSIERNLEQWQQCKHKCFVSIGCNNKEIERAKTLHEAGAEYFCVDVAHAHAKYVGKTLKKIRNLFNCNNFNINYWRNLLLQFKQFK